MSKEDPLGKSALFSPPPMAAPDDRKQAKGRQALYSAGPRRPGTVVVECSRCMNHSRMTTVEAMVRIAFISAWIPGKKFSRWMQCPECEKRTWCRVHWTG